MKRGPKPRQITKDLLEQIEHHAARGLSQKQICDASVSLRLGGMQRK